MKIYVLKRVQTLPITISEAWAFLAEPSNLPRITPPSMAFQIMSVSGRRSIYAGQVIQYRVRILPYLTTAWTTEITHVQAPNYFVDEQRFGPYALWQHQHHLQETGQGVAMTDEIHYAIGWGPLGNLANQLFVGRRLSSIFDYRFKALQEIFGPA